MQRKNNSIEIVICMNCSSIASRNSICPCYDQDFSNKEELTSRFVPAIESYHDEVVH